ncbi:MAG: hypothetical protein CMF25_01660 [Kangiellaceae bacterium]|nr:hypothetical protein [Kangiellaceae bacterium]
MDKHCYNHPMETARWYCENCHTLLCDRCIDADHAEDDHRLCGRCHKPSKYVPNKTDVVPFYHRVGDFFKYPFQESGLILLLITFLVTLFTSGVPFIGWIAALALLAVQTKYGFTAIKQLTEGDFKAPSLGDAIADSSFVIALKPVILYILMAVIVAVLWIKVATFLGVVAIIFFSLALPLSITILALEDSFSEALNPVRLATAMKRIGMPYLLVWFYLLMMISCSMTVTTILFENTTYTIANAGASVSGCYFTFVMYALMGYMIHQYRFELGAGPADSDLEVKQQSALKHPRVEALLVAGEYSKVMNLLEKEWANTAQNVNLALLCKRSNHAETTPLSPDRR